MDQLTASELKVLESAQPALPADYIGWLRQHGHGEFSGRLTVYPGPIEPDEIFAAADAAQLRGFVLVADDMAGFVVGFRPIGNGWELIGIESSGMQVKSLGISFERYIGNES